MDIKWIVGSCSGIVGSIVGATLAIAQQKRTHRRELLLKINVYYENLITSLKNLTHIANCLECTDKKDIKIEFDRARKYFAENISNDVLEITLLLKLDFDWGDKVFSYLNKAVKEGRMFAQNIETGSSATMYNISNFQRVVAEINYDIEIVKKFLILQTNIRWILFPTISICLRMFYEASIGCSFGKWLLHESPPPLKKDVPICRTVMGKLKYH